MANPTQGGVENAPFGVLPYYGRRQRMTFMFFDSIKTASKVMNLFEEGLLHVEQVVKFAKQLGSKLPADVR